ncbi:MULTISPECIES: DUF1707 and DUF4190 domain-containing protein [Streptomyces]|uniref:DUF1707 and DUF4190 domain-containing protein n=1 Tax=Streptomyces TaxID=1883 RepID=UPI000CD52FD4|nr:MULTISPECIES: DUF1707 and DUF4190 domain-containing protein [Streptomyces]
MRASHADRERTTDVLRSGYAEGRLDRAEFDRRVDQAHRAVTQGELQHLIFDLPNGPISAPAVPAQQISPVFYPQQQAPGVYPVPGMYPGPGHPGWITPVVAPRTNRLAVGALVCGLGGIFYGMSSIPAVILGHKSRAEIRRSNEEGDGMAMAGLVFGYLGLAFWGFMLLVGLVFFSVG